VGRPVHCSQRNEDFGGLEMTTEQEILELKTELTLERERHTKASGKDQTFNEWWSEQKKGALFPEIYTKLAEEWAFSGWHAGCLESWSGQKDTCRAC